VGGTLSRNLNETASNNSSASSPIEGEVEKYMKDGTSDAYNDIMIMHKRGLCIHRQRVATSEIQPEIDPQPVYIIPSRMKFFFK
jgi:hypothetical protein